MTPTLAFAIFITYGFVAFLHFSVQITDVGEITSTASANEEALCNLHVISQRLKYIAT